MLGKAALFMLFGAFSFAAVAAVEVHIDHFAQAAPDLEWIPEVGKRGWVLITRDANIRPGPLLFTIFQGGVFTKRI